ncbi:MFS transporter [Pseudalkalibacillus salsuginis]|uniref:MFS transporter n=1 Tax=Pseudalkalibacillus salsuginis TaxID=2910972 RepID=UPI001F39DB45|nr:MFS transporter [Pseudalkalibacillus salsuginis]MCF6409383.1 MFS transporter [Pseudalkalibacillus salsuginis]
MKGPVAIGEQGQQTAYNKKIHYAWIILALAFLTLLTIQGIRLSFGAFIEPWESFFQTNRGLISMVGMVSYIIFGISQPVIGKVVDHVGPRAIFIGSVIFVGTAMFMTTFANHPWQLFLLYGIIASIGFGGASQVTGTVVISNWFQKKRGLALGILSAGTAAGQLLIVPSTLNFINWTTWQTAVLSYGLFLMLIFLPLLVFFIKNRPSEMGLQPYGYTVKRPAKTIQMPVRAPGMFVFFKVLKKKEFWFLMLPFFVCGVTTSGLIDTHLIPFSKHHGVSNAVISWTIGLLAAFNFAGTITSGYLSDKWDCRKMLGFLYGLRGLTLVLLLIIGGFSDLAVFFHHNPAMLILFGISFGIVDFSTVAPTIKLATEYFKNYSIGLVVGGLFLSHQIGAALGSYLPGMLYDMMGNYQQSIIYAILILVAAAVMSFLLPQPENS